MRTHLAPLLAIAFVSAGFAGPQGPSFRHLRVDLQNASDCAAFAVSDDGRTVAGEVGLSPFGIHAFVLPLDAEPSFPSRALGYDSGRFVGLSSSGQYSVGTFGAGSGFQAVRWSAHGLDVLGDLDGGPEYSDAWATSASGEIVVGGSESANGLEAFCWTPSAGMIGLGDLSGGDFNSRAQAISADGAMIVGRAAGTSGTEAFCWSAADGMVGLGDLPGGGYFSDAYALSAASAGMVGLGDLPGGEFLSEATDVSADGATVVGDGSTEYVDEFGDIWTTPRAFIWNEADGLRDLQGLLTEGFGLNLDGWQLQYARGVSADGRIIVGTGLNPLSQMEAWVVQLPEPASVSMLPILLLYLRRMTRVTQRGETASAKPSPTHIRARSGRTV
jgi:probable HAF family extracellular repeat protein